MTAQIALLTDCVNELCKVARDPRFCKMCSSDRCFVKSIRMLARRVDELANCPQDTVMHALVARIWHNMSLRFNEQLETSSCARLPALFRNLDDMYREIFEEELLEKLNDMTDMELKWITQYSRNDRQLADLANEVLDRRSGV